MIFPAQIKIQHLHPEDFKSFVFQREKLWVFSKGRNTDSNHNYQEKVRALNSNRLLFLGSRV